MVALRTVARTMVAAVRLFRGLHLSDGIDDQPQCPHPRLFAHDQLLLSPTLLRCVFYHPQHQRFPHTDLCSGDMAHPVSVVSRQKVCRHHLLRLPGLLTGQLGLCSRALLRAHAVDTHGNQHPVAVVAHMDSIAIGTAHTLLAMGLLADLSGQALRSRQPFCAVDQLPVTAI